MRSLIARGLTLALSLSLATQLLSAADSPPKPASKAPAASPTPAPAAAPPAKSAGDKPASEAPAATGQATVEFDKLFEEWRDLLAKLRHIQEQYQVAPPADRPPLVKQFEESLETGRTLAVKLTAAAEKAYLQNPDDSRVADFLLSVEADNGRSENYEEAYRLGKLLIDHGYKKPAVYNITGIAAFCLNDYDAARKYLQAAADAGELSETGKRFRGLIDKYEGLWKKESELRTAEAKANDLPRVKLTTSKGDIVVELFENEAPNTTANFISLVEKGVYDGTPFHRVLPEFMAQGGDPQGTGRGGPGYTIACECYKPQRRDHFRGTLSMAHAGRDTGGSQFFLTFVPTDQLNGKHTVFGRIVEGMDVLAKLQRIDPEHPKGAQPDKILKAVVVRQREHTYDPVKKAA
jgi:cyclophilin family peptidyl-prolyl cis-trans isomerase